MARTLSLATLAVDVVARTSGFKLNGPRKELASFQASVASFSSKIGTLLKFGAVSLGAKVAFDKLRGVTEEMSTLHDTAARLGIGTEALTGLQYGAKFVGVEAESLNHSLKVLTKQIGEAVNGAGKAKPVFERMGLSAGTLARMAPEEALGRIADGLGLMRTEEERLAAAVRLFGPEGDRMLTFLEGGSKGLRAMTKEARALGATIGQQTANEFDKFGDSLDKLGMRWKAVSRTIAAEGARMGNAMFEAMSAMESNNRNSSGRVADQVFGQRRWWERSPLFTMFRNMGMRTPPMSEAERARFQAQAVEKNDEKVSRQVFNLLDFIGRKAYNPLREKTVNAFNMLGDFRNRMMHFENTVGLRSLLRFMFPAGEKRISGIMRGNDNAALERGTVEGYRASQNSRVNEAQLFEARKHTELLRKIVKGSSGNSVQLVGL